MSSKGFIYCITEKVDVFREIWVSGTFDSWDEADAARERMQKQAYRQAPFTPRHFHIHRETVERYNRRYSEPRYPDPSE